VDKEGWLHTGDIATVDKNGFFYIVDRLKELIKYNGYQVAPAELEGVLLTNPNILDAGVVGKPDPDAGELPTAFVVLKPGAVLTEKEIIDYALTQTSPLKKLRGGVIFIDQIPKTVSGKILRIVLKQKLIGAKL